MTPARFFVLEGVDGVGKSTQIDSLACWLRSLGHEVVTCRDPGTSEMGEAIRHLILHSPAPMDCHTEMLLYMAARAQLVAEVIKPALAANQMVVCDRYLLSNVVYQGFAGGLAMETIWQVGQIATQGLMPDLAIVLDLPEEVARLRRGPDADRMESRGSQFLQQVQQGFSQLAQQALPFPVALVDASASAESVHAHVRHLVLPLLAADLAAGKGGH